MAALTAIIYTVQRHPKRIFYESQCAQIFAPERHWSSLQKKKKRSHRIETLIVSNFLLLKFQFSKSQELLRGIIWLLKFPRFFNETWLFLLTAVYIFGHSFVFFVILLDTLISSWYSRGSSGILTKEIDVFRRKVVPFIRSAMFLFKKKEIIQRNILKPSDDSFKDFVLLWLCVPLHKTGLVSTIVWNKIWRLTLSIHSFRIGTVGSFIHVLETKGRFLINDEISIPSFFFSMPCYFFFFSTFGLFIFFLTSSDSSDQWVHIKRQKHLLTNDRNYCSFIHKSWSNL